MCAFSRTHGFASCYRQNPTVRVVTPCRTFRERTVAEKYIYARRTHVAAVLKYAISPVRNDGIKDRLCASV
ncbi:hypothetical protein PUN28_013632 [Cardiocondyla obscurior]|uniref:Uncharacterized protein n=1 Tax=Cardiocondyla obscurior TaxID=286306 RepID=A0AAW2F278_9HYME